MQPGKNDDGRIFERLTGRFGTTVAAHPGKVAMAFVMLTIVMAIPIQDIDMTTSMSDFAPESEFLEADDVLRTEFESKRTLLAILEARDGKVTDREGLQVLRSFEEAILASEEMAPYLVQDSAPVATLAGPVEAVLRSSSNGTVGIDTATDAQLTQAVEAVLSNESFSSMVSQRSTGRYTLVMVNLQHKLLEREDEAVEVKLRDILDETSPSGYTVHSFMAFSERMQEDTMEGLSIIMPLAILGVIAVLWISLRSVIDVVLAMVGVIVIFAITFGLFALAGLMFSQMTFFGLILILVLAIDFAIHVLYRYNENTRRGDDPPKAMARGIRFIGIAMLLSTMTTVAAFASNGLSTIPAVAGFGLFLAIGITVSFLVMVTFVPAMKLLASRLAGSTGGPRTARRGDGHSLRVLKVTRRYPVLVIMAATLLLVGSLIVAGNVPTNMSARDALAEDSEVIRTIDIVEREFPITDTSMSLVIVTGDVTDPEVLRALDAAISNMANDRYVVNIGGNASLTSVLPMIKRMTMVADNGTGSIDGDGDGLPDTRDSVNDILNSLWEGGIPGVVETGDVKAILSQDDGGVTFDGILIGVETTSGSVAETEVLLDELREDMGPVDRRNDVEVLYAGGEFEGYQMVVGMVDGMMQSTLATILICMVIVMVLLRSFRVGLITVLPTVMISGWVLGSMYVLGYTLNMVTATITAMTIGVGIDYSIHFMERYREERRRGSKMDRAINDTIATTGFSITAAATTTFFGFVVIAMSDITMFRTFGILSAIMIGLSLLSTLVLLPALITVNERFRFPWSLGSIDGVARSTEAE
jgi:hydrophobe/amphiphile efflux-3 (HAE3) family protein